MTAADDQPRRDPAATNALAGTVEMELRVVDVTDVTPSMRRVTFDAPELAAFAYEPGQDLMLSVPDDDRTRRRRYTIRRHDPAACTVDVDAVLHGHGPAATWFNNVQRGGRITAIGPRGKIALRTDVEWHLFVGDDSAIPVTLAWLEAVPASQTAVAVLETEGPEHEQPSARPATWLHRGDRAPGDPALVLEHLASLVVPEGHGAVYLNGERGVMKAARDVLVGRGIDPDSIMLKAYWVRDAANGDHGEPVPEGGFRGRGPNPA